MPAASSGFRPLIALEQSKNGLSDGWIKRLPGFFPANKEGTSFHEHDPADAVDIACNPVDFNLRNSLFRKWGLKQPHYTREPWHVEDDGSPVPSTAAPVNIPPVAVQTFDIGELMAESRLIQNVKMNGLGNGSAGLPEPPEKVLAIVANGSFPPGGGPPPTFEKANHDGKTFISIKGGPINGSVAFWVTVT